MWLDAPESTNHTLFGAEALVEACADIKMCLVPHYEHSETVVVVGISGVIHSATIVVVGVRGVVRELSAS